MDYLRTFAGKTTAFVLTASVFLAVYFVGVRLIASIARSLTVRWIRGRKAERPVVFSMEADALQWKTGSSSTRLGFSDIDQMFETGSLVGFMVAGSVPYVPKRVFGSPGECRMFVGHIFQHLSDEAKQRSLKQNSIRVAVS